jgi:hypothetical protein
MTTTRTDYEIVVDALAYMAAHCRDAGLIDSCDEYLTTLERIRYGDVELQPHRLTR